ncbi:hypothetical protein GDO81_024828 [Engystomops pustulosus]|uniref:SLP adapter and CSK-interacting membrane protein n=1 Tax=Engystomops pustulosus TaxID=76066 RepID=A0AAV6ZAT5_ENGPU|nr:hypothetical protein GDO81_024828 [Engystomops pustulosus]
MQNFWIIIVGVVSGMTLIMVLICLKTPLPRHLGCLIKKKRLPESTPQPETGVLFQPPQDYRGPASPLLEDAQITMPSQEEEKDLNYPIQASDENEIGEFAISK